MKLKGVVARTGNVTLNAGASQNVYFVLNQQKDMPEFTTYKITIDDLEKDVGGALSLTAHGDGTVLEAFVNEF